MAAKKQVANKRVASKKAPQQSTTMSPEVITLLVAVFAALSLLFFILACYRYA